MKRKSKESVVGPKKLVEQIFKGFGFVFPFRSEHQQPIRDLIVEHGGKIEVKFNAANFCVLMSEPSETSGHIVATIRGLTNFPISMKIVSSEFVKQCCAQSKLLNHEEFEKYDDRFLSGPFGFDVYLADKDYEEILKDQILELGGRLVDVTKNFKTNSHFL
jgi:hypothetical protein